MKKKLKTHSSAKKRFRFSKSGKIKFHHAFSSHRFLNKRPDTKRKYRKTRIVDNTNIYEIRRLMPYGK